VVVGGGLAGMVAAARLAKAGHPVRLQEASDRLGGRWAARPWGGGDSRVDDAPAVITFPAPWRDLFRKSGRPLEAELARTGHALVPAGPVDYVFADGSELVLPSDRGGQYAALTGAYGAGVAERWRDLVDDLDPVWQALRPLGLEAELRERSQLRQVRRALRQGRTVEDLARAAPHPHLAALVRSTAYRIGSDPSSTPAFCAVDLAVTRTFGRWTIQGPLDTDDTGRSSVLIEVLAGRLRLRRVEVRLSSAVTGVEVRDQRVTGVTLATGQRIVPAAVVVAVDPWQTVDVLLQGRPAGRLRRDVHRLTPARAAPVTHTRQPAPGLPVRGAKAAPGPPGGGVRESVTLTADGVPAVHYDRPVTGGWLRSTHDYTRAAPDPGAGVAWHRFADWLRRPPISTAVGGLYLAGPCSRGGATPSAVVLSGALAAYGVNAQLS
jgi:UDP-galactopyranose mutase